MPELLKNKRTGEYGYRQEDGSIIPVDVAKNKKTGAMGWRPKGSSEPWQVYKPSSQDTSGYVPIPGVVDAPAVSQAYTGKVLPFSTSETGDVSFDPEAGILGAIKRTVQAPTEAYRGEFDPASEEAAGRMFEAASVMTPIGAASRVPGSVFAPKSAYKTIQPKAPSREALKEATTAGYTEARGLGAEYTPSSIAEWANTVANTLNAEGRIATNYPKVHALLDKLKTPPKGASSITLESVDALYRELGRLGGDPAEGAVANIVQKGLDDFHAALDPSDLVAGTASPARAAEILKEARANAAAGFRSDRVTGLERTTARRTAAANSGKNLDNTIRQRLTTLIESAKGSRGLSKEEEAAIDAIIFGSKTKNIARDIGNLLGGGGGLGTTMLSTLLAGGGGATMGPGGILLGAIPPAIGGGARSMANAMSQRELRALDDLIRSRSPLASQQGPRQVYAPGVTQDTALKSLAAPRPQQNIQWPADPMARQRMLQSLGGV